MVSSIVKEGIPSLGLAPLSDINSGTSVHKRKGTVPAQKVNAKLLQKQVVLVQQEAEQHAAVIRKKLEDIEDQAHRAGAEIDLKETKQHLDGTLAELDATEQRVKLDIQRTDEVEHKAIVVDNTRRSATEAVAARQALGIAVNMGAIMGHVTDRVLAAIEEGEMELPDTLDIKTLSMMASSADKLTSALERAIKIEKGKAGEPEKNLGVQIGILLDGCTVEELDVIAEHGGLPTRMRVLVGGDGNN
jgi:hypothetical protein